MMRPNYQEDCRTQTSGTSLARTYSIRRLVAAVNRVNISADNDIK